MGIRNILIEGVSGSGKTSVAEELARRGYHVIHGDRTLAYVGDLLTGQRLNGPPPGKAGDLDWQHDHWIWPVEMVRALVADRRHPMTFFCGGSRNHRQFIDLFDRVLVLTVDPGTLADRLARRPADEFGGRPAERAFVLRRHAAGADVPVGAIPVEATAPLTQVVDSILLHAGDPTPPPADASAGAGPARPLRRASPLR